MIITDQNFDDISLNPQVAFKTPPRKIKEIAYHFLKEVFLFTSSKHMWKNTLENLYTIN